MEDYCKWHGVICVGEEDELNLDTFSNTPNRRHLQTQSADDSKVIGISLKENNLVGRTPSSLFQLPNLQSLYLSYNPQLDVSFLGGDQATKLVQLKLHSTGLTSMNGLDNFKRLLFRCMPVETNSKERPFLLKSLN